MPNTSIKLTSYIWNESEIRPKLFVQIPYESSTNAKDRFRSKKRNRFLEFRSEKIKRIQPLNFSFIRDPSERAGSL